jgi:putative ubiquitin-RnfH superfamily antitoxin RatB of RatAB toxin-antitoxin module
MSNADPIGCSVVCDAPTGPVTLAVQLWAGATLSDALAQARSQLGEALVDWDHALVGIWGQESARDRPLANGDRIEIYRRLPNDPKLARRARARAARLRRGSP